RSNTSSATARKPILIFPPALMVRKVAACHRSGAATLPIPLNTVDYGPLSLARPGPSGQIWRHVGNQQFTKRSLVLTIFPDSEIRRNATADRMLGSRRDVNTSLLDHLSRRIDPHVNTECNEEADGDDLRDGVVVVERRLDAVFVIPAEKAQRGAEHAAERAAGHQSRGDDHAALAHALTAPAAGALALAAHEVC